MFNIFFINARSNLADKIQPSGTNFESYLPSITAALSDEPSPEKEFQDAFFYIKKKLMSWL